MKRLDCGLFKRNSGRRWRSAVATTNSEGGIPERMVLSHEPKDYHTIWGAVGEPQGPSDNRLDPREAPDGLDHRQYYDAGSGEIREGWAASSGPVHWVPDK